VCWWSCLPLIILRTMLHCCRESMGA
jgi:hypothetical protein